MSFAYRQVHLVSAEIAALEWDGEPIPVERWGKDHWSTLAYVETRVVDHRGFVDDRHLRGHMHGWEKYPTRLRDGVLLHGHNDFDCIRDAVDAGLLAYADPEKAGLSKRAMERPSARNTWRGDRLVFTEEGWSTVASLRSHRGRGGKFANFSAALSGRSAEVEGA